VRLVPLFAPDGSGPLLRLLDATNGDGVAPLFAPAAPLAPLVYEARSSEETCPPKTSPPPFLAAEDASF
jgi:hypothetical protein